jgi:hypothetical protein
MSTILKKKMKRHKLRKKQAETNTIRLDKELTLKNVIQTQEQADFFMKMLKALQD